MTIKKLILIRFELVEVDDVDPQTGVTPSTGVNALYVTVEDVTGSAP